MSPAFLECAEAMLCKRMEKWRTFDLRQNRSLRRHYPYQVRWVGNEHLSAFKKGSPTDGLNIDIMKAVASDWSGKQKTGPDGLLSGVSECLGDQ
jgi:hypothetical protein